MQISVPSATAVVLTMPCAGSIKTSSLRSCHGSGDCRPRSPLASLLPGPFILAGAGTAAEPEKAAQDRQTGPKGGKTKSCKESCRVAAGKSNGSQQPLMLIRAGDGGQPDPQQGGVAASETTL